MAKKTKASKRVQAPAEIFVTRTIAAELLALSVERVDQLTGKGAIAKNAAGRVDVRSLCAHLRARIEEATDAGPDDAAALVDDGSGSPALERWRLARAAQEELNLAARQGEYVKREDVERLVSVAGSLLKSGGAELVARLPETLYGREVPAIATVLEAEIRKLLNTYAEQMEKAATEGAPVVSYDAKQVTQ